MRMRERTREQDYECASIVAALAEVALGRPWVAFEQVIAEAYGVLPADVRARLAAYDIEDAGDGIRRLTAN
jgi:lambda repressor-like predicted transcriptional regulator